MWVRACWQWHSQHICSKQLQRADFLNALLEVGEIGVDGLVVSDPGDTACKLQTLGRGLQLRLINGF